MRIYTMTATFGKLENQTISFQPGLNVIHAPNEWGKSTWCAFLTAMLYGLDTRAKTTKTVLADKDRYAPWSGTPMSGRIALSWNGRDITIERRPKGRTPMGDFSAYETATGLPVPELTAANCGQMLLGVERSVFQRAGFIQLSDMPVTQDEALRRRLNALVTTGDESNAPDDLAQKLKELKNKCRFNRSGLLPQAEAQREELEQKISQLQALAHQRQQNLARQAQLEQLAAQLENHKQALAYAASREGAQKVAQAADACDRAEQALSRAEQACQGLPELADAQQQLSALQELQDRQAALQLDVQSLASPPERPQTPVRYLHCTPDSAVQQAQADLDFVKNQEKIKKVNRLYLGIYAAVSVLLLALLLIPAVRPFLVYMGLALVLAGIAVLGLCAYNTKKMYRSIETVYQLHPGLSPDKWLQEAQSFAESYAAYEAALASAQAQSAQWNRRKESLQAQIDTQTQGRSLHQAMAACQQAITARQQLEDARREYERCVSHAEALRTIAKPVPPPAAPDSLTWSEPETLRLIADTADELQQLHTRLGQYQGNMDALGSESSLRKLLETVNSRIDRLTETYDALELALQTLSSASAELQRRFAPRIQQQAQDIFSRLTGGRYRRMILSEDLSVSTGSEAETTLRPAQWRSEGTMDQLYLSVRLAVARELTPHAPLILDDAFARFDDTRLAEALKLLQEEAQNRQILLFSCQSREKALMES